MGELFTKIYVFRGNQQTCRPRAMSRLGKLESTGGQTHFWFRAFHWIWLLLTKYRKLLALPKLLRMLLKLLR